VALEFRRNTSGHVGHADFAWVVEHVMGIKLRPELVGVSLVYLSPCFTAQPWSPSLHSSAAG
jgi:hypothetical protein